MKRNDLIQQKIDKTLEMQKNGVDTYPHKFNKQYDISYILDNFEKFDEKDNVTTAGRIMLMRKMGKASFAHIEDGTNRIQIYIRINEVGKDSFSVWKKLDAGDIVGVTGTLVKTKTGEQTIFVNKFQLLSKAIRSLPEKFHGLKDTETRYRQRYVDLIMNKNVKEIFVKRSRIIENIRSILNEKKFLEVETPMMQSIPGGATAKPFITHHNALDMDLYLRIAPELYLKRLIVGGLERVYEINKNFRNEGISTKHNPEFTMIELYSSYDDYNDMMDITEELVYKTALKVNGKETVIYGGKEINLKPPYNRIPYFDGLNSKLEGVEDVRKLSDDELKNVAKKYIKVENDDVRIDIINDLFEELVEPDLFQPTFIIDYPVEISPLTKKHRTKEGLVERFEFFIANNEIGNAYSELNDPIEQNKRFLDQIKLKELTDNDEISDKIDFDFLRALEYGMPPTGGLGIGIDRLAMILTGQESVREVILFPQLRAEEFTDF